MANLPDDDRKNQEKFMKLLTELDPPLAVIKDAMIQTNMDPYAVYHIIKSVGNVLLSTGAGKVEINIIDKQIRSVVSQEHMRFVIEEKLKPSNEDTR